MSDYSKEQIDKLAEDISKMTQYQLCEAWRFSLTGDPRFRNDLIASSGKSLGDIFSEKLKESGGFTPEISKALGW